MRYPVGKDKQDFQDNWYSAQGYGNPTNYGFHEGVDLNLKSGGDSDLGQPIYAICEGEVSSVHLTHPSTGFGNHIHIKHTGEFGTVWSHYAHCQDILVKVGDKIFEGQRIASVGRSGTTVAHLHFAIKNQPTGIDGIAKDKDQLKSWNEPLSFIETWMNKPSQKETEDATRALQSLTDGFKQLPDEDNLKRGNLEGFTRQLIEEHKIFDGYKKNSDILNGFIAKWISRLNVSDLLGIENYIDGSLKLEDRLGMLVDATQKLLGNVFEDDDLRIKALQVYEEDRKKKLTDLETKLSQCENKLSNSKVLRAFEVGGYIIKISKKNAKS